jgi:NitT/TauT family transport system substrate-binding protein
MVRKMLLGLAALAVSAVVAQAEAIKVGILKVGASGPVYIAQERGYFTAEGLQVELANFTSGQSVAVAVASGDIDIGVTGLTAGLYNLASGGQIRVIAGLHREARGFRTQGYFVSKRAYDAGLTSIKDIPGHSVALTTIGSTTHYAVALLAMKYGWPLASIRILPLQSNTNSAAAVVGGETDVAMAASTMASEIEKSGARLLGWVGDETPWQLGAVFAGRKTIANRGPILAAFLKAYRRGVHDFYEAFLVKGPDGSVRPGAHAKDMAAIIAKYTGQRPEQVEAAIPYIDPEGRLLVRDIYHQVAWYQSQGLVDKGIDVPAMLDYSLLIDAK